MLIPCFSPATAASIDAVPPVLKDTVPSLSVTLAEWVIPSLRNRWAGLTLFPVATSEWVAAQS